ncbi:hypothetical protein CVD27_07195 [Neobacillus cucumis]|uniref:DUF7674 domain-containing protein n=2 Tax=Neobacillus cucumis TaxID=1740721 RepID=A0A2N5HMK9_9BACI|nr:hypothetical protein CVD27_07195 [Neobacillus cucumis]
MNLLLEACPSYKPYYEENLGDDGEQLIYIDIMEFVAHLIELYKQNQINEFPKIFEVIELLHTDGDDFVKESATIGLLESIQNMSGDEINPDVFKKYLKPESLKWWNHLDDFWNGKTQWVGVPRK